MPQLTGILTQLEGASPSLAILATDPSLRGLIQAFSLSLGAAQMGMFESMPQTLNQLAYTVESVLAGRPTSFSWKEFLQSEPANPGDRRRLIAIWPKLDFSSLEPGRQATAAIREAGERANLASDFRARPPTDRSRPNRRSGIFNPATRRFAQRNRHHSSCPPDLVARSTLFQDRAGGVPDVGRRSRDHRGARTAGRGNLQPDLARLRCSMRRAWSRFAIRFSVRYRAERQAWGELRKAVALTSLGVRLPLTLAAASAAAGFMSFLPTDYIGMAELGLIAGFGMGIAYLTSMLLLPALLQILIRLRSRIRSATPPSRRSIGSWRHRIAVVVTTTLVVMAGLPLLPHLRFDFNPLDLRSPDEEAMATYSELSQDPLMNANLMEVLTTHPTPLRTLRRGFRRCRKSVRRGRWTASFPVTNRPRSPPLRVQPTSSMAS